MSANIVSYEFITNALIVGVIIGILLPIIGIIILIKKLSFITDALGHINMSGVAFSVFLANVFPNIIFNNDLIIILWTIIGAVLIEYLRNKYTEYKEISIMVVYSLGVALTIIFLNLSKGYNNSLFNILFGNINIITRNEVLLIIIISLIVLAFILYFYKKILYVCLEEEMAKIYHYNVTVYKYLIMIFLAIIITISVKIIGILLVSSLTILPILAANKLSKNLKQVIIFSIIFTELSIILGIFLAYYLNISTSAMIVLIILFIYLVVNFIRRK